MLDNHIQQGNTLDIDVRRITWKRCVDMNDRQLRNIVCGLGGKVNGVPREDGFDITVASEIMAVLCLADSLTDLEGLAGPDGGGLQPLRRPRNRPRSQGRGSYGRPAQGRHQAQPGADTGGHPRLHPRRPLCQHRPRLQLRHGHPGGPQDGRLWITEAGFGADLGAEKFLDIKCRLARLHPDAVVVVATVRALTPRGWLKAELGGKPGRPEAGRPSQLAPARAISPRSTACSCVVAVNRFPTDTEAELELVENRCRALGVNVALSEVWAKGGEGGVALAEEVIRLCDAPNHFTFSYELDASIEDKLAAIVTKVYHGDGVVLTPTAQKQAAELTELGFGSLPICMAKTQYSFSDNAALLGAPRGFTITVRNIKVSAGAGFLVALTGDIMTMPGLPKVPAAEKVDVDENGRISGLF